MSLHAGITEQYTYRTSDGKLFTEYDDAAAHQEEICMTVLMENDNYYNKSTGVLELENSTQLRGFLLSNKNYIFEFMKWG